MARTIAPSSRSSTGWIAQPNCRTATAPGSSNSSPPSPLAAESLGGRQIHPTSPCSEILSRRAHALRLFLFHQRRPVVADICPKFEPEPVQMRRHVEHLFGGWLDGCHEGRIELCWTDRARRQAQPRRDCSAQTSLTSWWIAPPARTAYPGRTSMSGRLCAGPMSPHSAAAGMMISLRLRRCTPTWTTMSRPRRRPTAVAAVVRQQPPSSRADTLLFGPKCCGGSKAQYANAAACRQQILALAQALDGDRTVFNPGPRPAAWRIDRLAREGGAGP